MPISHSTGFTAGICYAVTVPPPPPPPPPPQDGTDSTTNPMIRWHVCQEFGLANTEDETINTWIQLPLPFYGFRVYFSRDFSILPRRKFRQGEEEEEEEGIYAGFLTMNQPTTTSTTTQGANHHQTFYKCFGIVENNHQHQQQQAPWFIEGTFGDIITDLNFLRETFLELKICRAFLKKQPNSRIGDGLLEPETIETIDTNNSLIEFKWFYGTKEQLETLGLIKEIVPLPHSAPQNDSATCSSSTPPTTAALEFLRKANQTLISILTIEQKKRFVETIIDWKEIKQLTDTTITGDKDSDGTEKSVKKIWEEVLKSLEMKEGTGTEEETKEIKGEESTMTEEAMERRRSLRKRD